MEYDGGTKLKDARNRQIYPYTKAEYVEGLEDSLTHMTEEIKRLEGMIQSNTPTTPPVAPPSGGTSSGFVPMLVSELPEVGEVGVVYRVLSENTSSMNTYDEFYWTGTTFEKIGNRDPGGDEWGSEDGDSGYVWEDD